MYSDHDVHMNLIGEDSEHNYRVVPRQYHLPELFPAYIEEQQFRRDFPSNVKKAILLAMTTTTIIGLLSEMLHGYIHDLH